MIPPTSSSPITNKLGEPKQKPTVAEKAQNIFLKSLASHVKYPAGLMGDDGGGGGSKGPDITDHLIKLSMLESQEENTNQLKSMSSGMSEMKFLMASNMLNGKEIKVESNKIAVTDTGCPQGIAFDLPAGIKKSTIKILTEKGHVVRRIDGPNNPGNHRIVFDGKAPNGAMLPPGIYTIAVEGDVGKGEPLSASTTLTGKASNISLDSNQVNIHMHGITLPFSAYRGVEATANPLNVALQKNNDALKDISDQLSTLGVTQEEFIEFFKTLNTPQTGIIL